MSKVEIMKTVGGAFLCAFLGWVALGLYGASIGSTDSCTESLGAAVRWALGTERAGVAE